MINNKRLEDFDLEVYEKNFFAERNRRIQYKNKLAKEKVLYKIASFIIMIVFIAAGSFLYHILSNFIQSINP